MNQFNQSFEKIFNDNENIHQILKRDRETPRTRKHDEKSAIIKSREKTFIQPSNERRFETY